MGIAKKVTKTNHLPSKDDGRFPVYSHQFNELVDVVNELEPSDGNLAVTSLTADTVTTDTLVVTETQISTNVVEKTVEVTLTATEIVGTAAGDLGHTGGAILVTAPTSAYALEFVSATLIYDFDTAAYTGAGANDLVIRIGTTSVSSAIADADLLLAAGDQVVHVRALSAADYDLPVGSSINLKSTAVTQPGTAAGVIRAIVTYRQITTNL